MRFRIIAKSGRRETYYEMDAETREEAEARYHKYLSFIGDVKVEAVVVEDEAVDIAKGVS